MGRLGVFSSEEKFSTSVSGGQTARLSGFSTDTVMAASVATWVSERADAFTFTDLAKAVAFGGGGLASAVTAAASTWKFAYTSGDAAVADANEYNIRIDFYGETGQWTAALIEDFVAAADYLSTIITQDLPDFNASWFSVDDLRIKATLTDIDGEGGILGQAGPTYLRSDSQLPFLGIMEFDVADAEAADAAGLWDEIVLHEMLHVLGIGSLWETLGLVETTYDDKGTWWKFDDEVIDIRYTGAAANEAFAEVFPEIYDTSGGLGIFVETDGGSGTAGAHWDEDIFDAELMTGYLNASGNYLSDMTIAALEDLGYDTVWNSALV